MPPIKNVKRLSKKQFQPKISSWKREEVEVTELKHRYDDIDPSAVKTFSDLPLSHKTQEGLHLAKFVAPTDIQRECIGLALQGHDVLGAAKTGSGKTLAFLIPVLESMFCRKWTQLDGLGALIVSPTRELAYQTFEVLRKIGKKHDFSAGLVIGGKHLREEAEKINRTNIIICTPGRLLQHMDETVNFTADSLFMLVLDEADRILDLGFAQTMNAIVENLPSERQTLLFSATQTKSIKDLARLSLNDPMYVSVHENATHKTPQQLKQSYIVCELHDKINLLWSFIKNHLKQKILVFMSSCKQVKYIYEQLRHMQPGNSILALHGGMHQLKRVDVYRQFVRKEHAVLVATDIAARGLDFPSVHWVLQLDCPEDTNTYIHRAGRTARYEKNGESLLVVLPSEETMIQLLCNEKIPIENIKINPKKLRNIQGKLESSCASNVEMKEMAQRAFVSYLKSVFLMGNKNVFNVNELDFEKFSRSLGLALSPRVRFLQRHKKRDEQLKKKTGGGKSDVDEVSDSLRFNFNDESDDDDILKPKGSGKQSHLHASGDDEFPIEREQNLDPSSKQIKTLTKYAMAKRLLKKKFKINEKVQFSSSSDDESDGADGHDDGGLNLDNAMRQMSKADIEDKIAYKEKIRRKHMEKRIKMKEERRATKQRKRDEAAGNEEAVAYLGHDSDMEETGGDNGRIEAEQDLKSEFSCNSDFENHSTIQPLPKKATFTESNSNNDSSEIEDDEAFALALLKQ